MNGPLFHLLFHGSRRLLNKVSVLLLLPGLFSFGLVVGRLLLECLWGFIAHIWCPFLFNHYFVIPFAGHSAKLLTTYTNASVRTSLVLSLHVKRLGLPTSKIRKRLDGINKWCSSSSSGMTPIEGAACLDQHRRHAVITPTVGMTNQRLVVRHGNNDWISMHDGSIVSCFQV
jgi:hypothetical protein